MTLGFSVIAVKQDFVYYEAWFYNQNNRTGGKIMSAYAFLKACSLNKNKL